jgi:hypothetical protein
MGQSATHNINIVWSNTGLDTVTSASNNFAKTSTTVAKSQDQVSTALTKTQGAAVKTGKEYTNVTKASTNTAKTTGTLGKAFKGSSLQISAFASSLTSSFIQIDSLMDQEMKLSGMRARLDKQTTTLTIAEQNLAKKFKEGKISGEDYRLQSEKLANQRAVLAVKEEQYADAVQDNKVAWVAMATTVLPTVLTAFSSLSGIIGTIRSTQQTATAATNVLATATTGLGTAATTTGTRGITPLITGLKNFVLGGKDTTTVLGTKSSGLVGGISALSLGFTDTEKSGNIFIRTFKNLGTSVKDFFSRIKTDMGASTGIIDKIKTGFSSFFTQVGTGFKGFGGHLKTAGAAFVTFGKTLMGVFLSNPILLVIGAIATAVGALIFDLGGFRTRLNELGVTLGKMAPWAKPFLDALGWIGQQFAGIGNWIMGTNKLADATQKGGAAAKKAAGDFDTHFQAIQKVFNVSKDFSKFEGIVANLKNVKTAIDSMKVSTAGFGITTIENLGNASNAFETFNSGIVKGVPEIDAKVKEIQKTFEDMRTGTLDLAEGEKILEKQLGELETMLVNNIHTNQNKIKADKESAIAMKGTSKVMTEAERIIKTYNSTTADSETVFKDFAIALVEGNYDVIEAMGLTEEEIGTLMDRFKKEYPEGADVITKNGVKIIKSFKDIKDAGVDFAKEITTTVKDAAKNLTADLPPTLENIRLSIQKLSKEEQLAADISRLAATGIYNDKKKLEEAVKALAVKYGLTKSQADEALKSIQSETQNLVKEQDKATQSTDKMATAQEKAKKVTEEWKASMDAIAQSFQTFGSKGTSTLQSVGQKLLDIADKARAASEEFITGEGKRKERKEKFHETMMKLYDEEEKAIGNMDVAVARQSHVWAEWSTMATESVNNFAASALVGEFPAAITAIETALDNTPAQWAGATGQLDEVLNNTALNARDKANLIASDMTMLENAMKPVQVGAELVGKAGAEAAAGLDEVAAAALKNVNPLTEMDSAWATFTSKLSPAQKELGLVQAVMKGVESGTLTAAEAFQILGTAGEETSKQMGSTVTSSLANLESKIIDLGNGTSATVAKMDGQWVHLGTSTATNLGNAQSQVQNLEGTISTVGPTTQTSLAPVPGIFSQAFIDASNAAGTQLQGMVTKLHTAMSSMSTSVSTYSESMKANFSNFLILSADAISLFTPAITTLQQAFSTLSTSIATYATSMTTTIGAFVKASTVSMGAFAGGPIKVVQGALSTLSTSTATYSKSMTTNISGFAKSAGTSLNTVGTAAFGAQGKLSTMSKSVATYMSSMSTNVSNFASKFSSAMKTVGSQADAATKKVAALKKAVDSLKSKSINIHVGLSGPGAAYLKTGGAFISPEPTGFAQSGKSWVNSKPRKIGGVNISEFGKPELVTVTPLSNPMDPTDKNINMNIPIPKPQSIPRQMTSGINNNTTGGGGSRQPINVELHTTVTMPDGKVLAKAVQQHLLSGFSGIT